MRTDVVVEHAPPPNPWTARDAACLAYTGDETDVDPIGSRDVAESLGAQLAAKLVANN